MKVARILFTIIVVFFTYKAYAFFNSPRPDINFDLDDKIVALNDNGLDFSLASKAVLVSDLLKQNNITMGDHDEISPSLDSKIYPEENITIRRAVKIKIIADGKTIDGYTLQNNIRAAVTENGVTLSRLDKTTPDLNSLPQDGMTITVTRINVEDVTTDEDIAFPIVTKNDPSLGWRETNVTTPGVKGTMEVKYRVTYKNNQVISKVVLEKTIVTKPIAQVQTQGTYVKVGNAQKGQGTWYVNQGGMYAASLTIPHGGYAKVTNTATGQSVIVQINDSGPYGSGRIIDLDKVAFEKIASIGAGVIGVKVEEVLN